jgi:hypothetical protein
VDYRPEYEELQRAFGRLHGGRGTVTLAAVERYRLWRNRRKENTLSRARFLVLASREVPSAKQGAGLVHLFTFNPTLDEAARLQIDDYIESLWRGGWSSSVREVVNEFGWQDALDYGRGIQASGRPVSVGRSAPEDDGRFGDVLHFNGTGKP